MDELEKTFPGLNSAMKKLKVQTTLDMKDKRIVASFVDSFSTCDLKDEDLSKAPGGGGGEQPSPLAVLQERASLAVQPPTHLGRLETGTRSLPAQLGQLWTKPGRQPLWFLKSHYCLVRSRCQPDLPCQRGAQAP